MVERIEVPKVWDLSIESGGRKTHFTVAEYKNRNFVTVSDIGKVGQIVEVIFPHPVIASTLHRTHNIEYDTKVLLGPPLEQLDLLLNRLIHVFASHGVRRNAIFAFGVEEFSAEQTHLLVRELEQHLSARD